MSTFTLAVSTSIPVSTFTLAVNTSIPVSTFALAVSTYTLAVSTTIPVSTFTLCATFCRSNSMSAKFGCSFQSWDIPVQRQVDRNVWSLVIRWWHMGTDSMGKWQKREAHWSPWFEKLEFRVDRYLYPGVADKKMWEMAWSVQFF